MKITMHERTLLKKIVTNTYKESNLGKGYSICDLADVKDIANVDTLSLAREITNTTYLMARATAANTLFVHFTTKENANKIIDEGFNLTNSNDYSNALCCFRIDAMSRAFKTPIIDTAIIFNYTGEYLSCVRQEDSNSNIGYQIIENLSGISEIAIYSLEDFVNDKLHEKLNYESILTHHGLSISLLIQIVGVEYKYLSTILPEIYEKEVYGEKPCEETNEF